MGSRPQRLSSHVGLVKKKVINTSVQPDEAPEIIYQRIDAGRETATGNTHVGMYGARGWSDCCGKGSGRGRESNASHLIIPQREQQPVDTNTLVLITHTAPRGHTAHVRH